MTCPTCNGTGHEDDLHGNVRGCPLCFGAGELDLDAEDVAALRALANRPLPIGTVYRAYGRRADRWMRMGLLRLDGEMVEGVRV